MAVHKLYEDVNQKQGHHTLKNKYWQSKGIYVDRSHRLIVGDYMLSLDAKISVDTKQDLVELASNMFCDKSRFEKRKAETLLILKHLVDGQTNNF